MRCHYLFIFSINKMIASSVFKSKFGVRNIKKTYKEKVSSKGTVGRDRVSSQNFKKNLDQEIDLINKRVLSGSYRFTGYKQLLISKGAGKAPRVLSVPTQRDRLTLRCLCDFLFEIYPDQKTQIPQKKIKDIQNAILLEKYSHYVKIDVKDFYPSIDHDILRGKLAKKIRKKEIFSLILSALKNPTLSDRQSQRNSDVGVNLVGVPQGLSISNVLAEIYLADFDAVFKNNKNIEYFRYVDDILILCNSPELNFAKSAIDKIELLKLKAHDFESLGSKSKCGLISDGFDFLGYEFKGVKTSPRHSSIKNFEESLVKEFTTYKYLKNKFSSPKAVAKSRIADYRFQWHLNLKITGCIFDGRRYGWLFYYSQSDNTSKFREIDSTIGKLIKRFEIPSSFRIKKMLKAFYESKRIDKDTHTYIPNFDIITLREKKEILQQLGIDTKKMKETQIKDYFFKIVRKATKELEKDLHSFS